MQVNRLFVLVYSDQVNNAARFKARRYCLPKGIIKSYKIIISLKAFYDQAIDSDIKWHKKIRNQQQSKVKIILLNVC